MPKLREFFSFKGRNQLTKLMADEEPKEEEPKEEEVNPLDVDEPMPVGA